MAMKTDRLKNFLALNPPVTNGLCLSAFGSSSALPCGSYSFYNWELLLERGEGSRSASSTR